MYFLYFLARFYPFWGLPLAFVFFELGMFFYYRRVRRGYGFSFGLAFTLVIWAILWIVYGGYWNAGPFLKRTLENFGT